MRKILKIHKKKPLYLKKVEQNRSMAAAQDADKKNKLNLVKPSGLASVNVEAEKIPATVEN